MAETVLFDDDGLALADSAKIVKGSEYDLLSRALAGVDSAEREAEEIVAEAKEEAARILSEARERTKREAAAFAAEQAARTTRDLDTAERRLVGIVRDALTRILDPIPPEERIAAAVRCAAAEVDLSRGATLIVAPEIFARVQDALTQSSLDGSVVELRGDPACPPESTLLRTPYGDIELDVDSQIAALIEGVRAAMAERA